MSIVTKALLFATEHHKDQFRKGTRIPYMAHLLNVCKILAERNCSDEVLAAKKQLEYWINLALEHNPFAESSKKKKRKS